MTSPHTTPSPGRGAGDHQRTATEGKLRTTPEQEAMRNLIHNANNIHDRRSMLKTGVNLRRLAGTLAVMATAVGGFSAFATPAGAATGPTARLHQGALTVTGTAARDVIGITINANRLAVDFGADGTVDAQFRRSRIQRVQVLAGKGDDGVSFEGSGVGDLPITASGQGGNDNISVVGNIGDFGTSDLPIAISGGGGNDNLLAATPGRITVHAGAGADRVDGGGAGTGRETVSLGDGNDRFLSRLTDFVVGGTRSDIVDGGAGRDTMEMQGSFATESIGLSANAGHLIVDHDLRDRIDADNVEEVLWRGFGGLDEGGSGDAVAVDDLSGTDVIHFTPDFTDPLDGRGPNNSPDTLTVRGTAGVDHITVSGSGANITVTGLVPLVTPINLAPDDFLRIETLAGHDTVDRSGLQAGLVQLRLF